MRGRQRKGEGDLRKRDGDGGRERKTKVEREMFVERG